MASIQYLNASASAMLVQTRNFKSFVLDTCAITIWGDQHEDHEEDSLVAPSP